MLRLTEFEYLLRMEKFIEGSCIIEISDENLKLIL